MSLRPGDIVRAKQKRSDARIRLFADPVEVPRREVHALDPRTEHALVVAVYLGEPSKRSGLRPGPFALLMVGARMGWRECDLFEPVTGGQT